MNPPVVVREDEGVADNEGQRDRKNEPAKVRAIEELSRGYREGKQARHDDDASVVSDRLGKQCLALGKSSEIIRQEDPPEDPGERRHDDPREPALLLVELLRQLTEDYHNGAHQKEVSRVEEPCDKGSRFEEGPGKEAPEREEQPDGEVREGTPWEVRPSHRCPLAGGSELSQMNYAQAFSRKPGDESILPSSG
jgi:hypothetical protein